MKTIQMGLNTEPDFLKADEVIKRWEAMRNTTMVHTWEKMKRESLMLRDEIREAVEADGVCVLSWSCMGRTRHEMHARQWAHAMPEYDFTINGYDCTVRKLVPMPGADKLAELRTE